MRRLDADVDPRKYDQMKQQFILECYQQYPLSFFDEVRQKFITRFPGFNISISSVWRIIRNHGLTRKVIERRAIQISKANMIRFCNDLNSLPFHWTWENLVFLDEVGFDNRDICFEREDGSERAKNRLPRRVYEETKMLPSLLSWCQWYAGFLSN